MLIKTYNSKISHADLIIDEANLHDKVIQKYSKNI